MQIHQELLTLTSLNFYQNKIAETVLAIFDQFKNQNLAISQQMHEFFITILNNPNSSTQQTLLRIAEIAKKELFTKFLEITYNKQEKNYLISDLNFLVSEFYDTHIPQQNFHSDLDKTHLSEELQEAFENLMNCLCHIEFFQLAETFLQLLNPDQKCSQEIYDYLFHLLHEKYSKVLNPFEIVAFYKAIFSLHLFSQCQILKNCSKSDIYELVSNSFQLKRHAGSEFFIYFFLSLSKSSTLSFRQLMEGLHQVLLNIDGDDFIFLAQEWQEQGYSWIDFCKVHPKKYQENEHITPPQDEIIKQIDRFKNDPTVTQPLSDKKIKQIFDQYQIVETFCKKYENLHFNELINIAHIIREKAKISTISDVERLQLAAIGILAIQEEIKIKFYNTQILAVLGTLLDNGNKQAQVKTGEGKSIIIALWTFVKAMEFKAVDIVTTSRSLAKRDQKKFAKFFRRCGITSSHICYDKKVKNQFTSQILYGPAFDFEFAWMEDLLYGSNLFEARLETTGLKQNFDQICVDESDCLLIDTARNGTRMSSKAEVSYDWVYAPILSFVKTIKGHSLKNRDNLIRNLRQFLIKEVPEENKKMCHFFADSQLKIWLNSAYHALEELVENRDYVIRNNRRRPKPTIQIVDLRTGRISKNSRWQNGIHEFLEVKHGIAIDQESICPLTLPHSVFYSFYKSIIAFTGTAERFQTKNIYHIDSFDVPSYLPSQRIDLPTIISETAEDYYANILQITQDCINKKRPILILCETIQQSKVLSQKIKEAKIDYNLLNALQKESEEGILSQAGDPAKVTIATNTAGRGTDIILTPKSIKNGGLHVLITFYPDSQRVEDQNRGRAGRQGQPGSSQMILNKERPEIKRIIGDIHDDQQIMERLAQYRELQETYQSRVLVSHSEIEKFLFKLIQVFFISYRQWCDVIDDDALLTEVATELLKLSLPKNKKFSSQNLNLADFMIFDELKEFLVKQQKNQLDCKIFLKKVGQRLKNKILNQWTKDFFEPNESYALKESAMISKDTNILGQVFVNLISSQRSLERYTFDQLNEEILTTIQKQKQAIQNHIQANFEASQASWEKYMKPGINGLLIYLKEILSIQDE